jgi:hypothetical protein
MGHKIVVNAPRHSYVNTPVSIPWESEAVALKDVKTGRIVAAQVADDRLHWIVEELPKGGNLEYEVEHSTSNFQLSTSKVEAEDVGEKIDFRVAGELFTSYHFDGKYARPFLYPIIGPGGKGVTRNYPMADVPGETTDHKHHRSVWVAHGDVNGVDNWSEEPGHGKTVHRTFTEKISGPVFGRISETSEWVDKDGNNVLDETRSITVYNLPDTGRLMDVKIVFHADKDVKFGDTKEGGILSVRVATSMDGDKGGLITNSFGGITEAETWGKRAQWCDYSGPVDGRMVGITIFDNPRNFRHPTYWHVRDYGLMTANPFALSAYKNDPSADGSHTWKAGESFSFAYRLYIHDGDADTGRVAEQYHGYVNPPAAQLS